MIPRVPTNATTVSVAQPRRGAPAPWRRSRSIRGVSSAARGRSSRVARRAMGAPVVRGHGADVRGQPARRPPSDARTAAANARGAGLAARSWDSKVGEYLVLHAPWDLHHQAARSVHGTERRP